MEDLTEQYKKMTAYVEAYHPLPDTGSVKCLSLDETKKAKEATMKNADIGETQIFNLKRQRVTYDQISRSELDTVSLGVNDESHQNDFCKNNFQAIKNDFLNRQDSKMTLLMSNRDSPKINDGNYVDNEFELMSNYSKNDEFDDVSKYGQNLCLSPLG